MSACSVHRGLHVVSRSCAIARAHKTSFRFRVLLEFLQGRSHGTGVNDDFVLRVSRFQFIQVTFQRLALAHAPRAAYRSELRAIDSNPLAPHPTYRACKPEQLRTRLRHRIYMTQPQLNLDLAVGI